MAIKVSRASEPAKNSMRTYKNEIGALHVRHRPRSIIHEIIGIKSNQRMVVAQLRQDNRFFNNGIDSNKRTETTFKKEPQQAPAINTKNSFIIGYPP
jgi:hypothetical protein